MSVPRYRVMKESWTAVFADCLSFIRNRLKPRGRWRSHHALNANTRTSRTGLLGEWQSDASSQCVGEARSQYDVCGASPCWVPPRVRSSPQQWSAWGFGIIEREDYRPRFLADIHVHARRLDHRLLWMFGVPVAARLCAVNERDLSAGT